MTDSDRHTEGRWELSGARPAVPAARTLRLDRVPSVRPFLALTTLAFLGFFATLASLPQWAARNGASTVSAGLVNTVLLAATVIAQPLVPAILARLGTRRSLGLGVVLLGGPAVLFAVRTDLASLLVANAVRGVGFAVVTVVGSALTAILAPPGRQGEMAGLYGLAIAVPNLAAIPASVWLAQNVGFWPVAVLAALPVLAVPLAPSVEQRRPDPGRRHGRKVTHRSVVVGALLPAGILTVVTLAGGAVLAYLPIERPSGAIATSALFLLGLTAALTRWRVGAFADRVGTRLLLPAAVFCAAAGLFGIAGGLTAGHDLALLASAGLFGVGYGSVQNLTLVLSFARAGVEAIPTASAAWNLAFDAGTALGPVVVGVLLTAGLTVPIALTLVAVTVALALPVAAASDR